MHNITSLFPRDEIFRPLYLTNSSQQTGAPLTSWRAFRETEVDFLEVSGRPLVLQRESCLEGREANPADSYGSRLVSQDV